MEYPKNYRSIQVQEVVFLPQFAVASRQRRFTALTCFFIWLFLVALSFGARPSFFSFLFFSFLCHWILTVTFYTTLYSDDDDDDDGR